MNLRKIALLVFVCSMVYVFGVNASFASANTGKEEDAQITATAAPETALSDEAPEVPAASAEPVENLAEPTATPAADTTDDASKKDTSKKDTSKKDTSKKDTSKKNTSKKNTSKKNTKKRAYTKGELRLMASIINCEAGGECFQGKLAVGIVVMNRVRSKAFPNTVRGVIYQKNQFTPARNGILKNKLKQYDSGRTKSAQWKSCIRAAKKTLSGLKTIIRLGKVKSMKGIYFFSVGLPNAKFKLGGHRFK